MALTRLSERQTDWVLQALIWSIMFVWVLRGIYEENQAQGEDIVEIKQELSAREDIIRRDNFRLDQHAKQLQRITKVLDKLDDSVDELTVNVKVLNQKVEGLPRD